MQQMPLSDNKCHKVEHGAVRIDLLREKPQRVSIAFEFVSVQLAIDHSQVNPR